MNLSIDFSMVKKIVKFEKLPILNGYHLVSTILKILLR